MQGGEFGGEESLRAKVLHRGCHTPNAVSPLGHFSSALSGLYGGSQGGVSPQFNHRVEHANINESKEDKLRVGVCSNLVRQSFREAIQQPRNRVVS